MPCFFPLKAFRSLEVDPSSGKHGVVFNPSKALIGVAEGGGFRLACGQCGGCRSDRAQQWAIRCSNEAQMHDHNCFLTLTYSDEHVPRDFSVKKRHLQLFHMRAQEAFGAGKRYFSCGEYGDLDGRPHYHVLGFGFDFSEDRKPWAKRDGHQVWRSDRLERLWPFGHSEIGSVTAQSAGYVARYCAKKMTGEAAKDHYLRPSPVDGELHAVEPEFALMSRRPGIGARWLERFQGDCFPSDFVVVDGRRKPVPRYYVLKLSEAEAEARKRRKMAREFGDPAGRRRRRENETPERLEVRAAVHAARVKRLVRSI